MEENLSRIIGVLADVMGESKDAIKGDMGMSYFQIVGEKMKNIIINKIHEELHTNISIELFEKWLDKTVEWILNYI